MSLAEAKGPLSGYDPGGFFCEMFGSPERPA